MAYELRDFSDVAPATTVGSDITNVSTTITLASGTGYPSGGAAGDFIIQIESELVRCSARSGDSITVSGGVAGRGINGTTAVSHVTGVAVNHVHTAINDSKEANYAVSKTVGKVTATQDLLVADGANSFTRLPIGADGTILQALAGAVAYGALGVDVVTATQIAPGAVGSSELGTASVIAGKIAPGGVSAATQFGTGVVESAAILDGTIVNADINAAAGITLSKLATDPLARANHTGTQLAATVSDFDTQVRTSRLDQMTAPTGSVSFGSQKITSLATPTATTDAATKAYADKCRTLTQSALPGAGNWNSGDTISTITITDPGYNIVVWVAGSVAATANTLAYWELQCYVDGVKSGGIIIPQANSGVNQTYAVLGVPTNHTAGTNCTVLVKPVVFSGTGTVFNTAANTGANNLFTVFYTWNGT